MSLFYYYLRPLSLSFSFEWLQHLICLLSLVPCAPQKSLSHTNSLCPVQTYGQLQSTIHQLLLITCISRPYSDTRSYIQIYVHVWPALHCFLCHITMLCYAVPANLSIYISIHLSICTSPPIEMCIPAPHRSDQPTSL